MMVATGRSFASAPTTAMVGSYNGSTCTGIGPLLAITARHNNTGATATFGGVARTVTRVIPHPSADLALLILSGTELAEYHALPTATPAADTAIMIGGFGFEGTVGGEWYGSRAERWVTNKVSAETTDDEIHADFSDPAGAEETASEGMVCMNDSGGAMVSSDGATVYGIVVHAHGGGVGSSVANEWGATLYGADSCGVNLVPHVAWIKSASGNPDGPAVLPIVWNAATEQLTITLDREATVAGTLGEIEISVEGAGYVGDSVAESGSTITVTMTAGFVSVAPGRVKIPAGMFSADGELSAEIDEAPYVDLSESLPPVLGVASTAFNTMSAATIYCSRGAGDVASTHFKIVAITYGTLYLEDGTTALEVGDFITVDQGAAGLRCLPMTGYAGTIRFEIAAALDDIGTGLSTASESFAYVEGSGSMAKPVISGVSAAFGEDTLPTTAILESSVTFADSILADATLLSDAIGLTTPNDGFVIRLPNGVPCGANSVNSATLVENPHLISTTYFAAITTSVTAGRASVLADMFENSDGGENNDAATDIATTWVGNNTMTPAADGSITFGTGDWTGTDAISGKRTRWVNWTAPISGAYRFSVQGTIATTTNSTFTVYTKANGVPVGTVTSAGASMNLTVQLTGGVDYLLAFFAFQPAGTKSVGLNCTTLAASEYSTPSNAATGVALEPTLAWNAVIGATGFNVYLDTVNPPVTQIATGTGDTEWPVDPLEPGTTYYWRVDSVDGTGTATGEVWSFTTAAAASTGLSTPLLVVAAMQRSRPGRR